jgi:hypothetical protein
LKAKINGKKANLCFDSGSNASALCPRAVQKLGLRFIPAPTNNFSRGVLAGDTEDCTLTLEGMKGTASFLVLDLPAYAAADFDGLIGWFPVSRKVLRIDAVGREVAVLPKVPSESTQWARFCLLTNFEVLDLQVPHTGRTNGVLSVDTGDARGLALPMLEWHRWKEAHPHASLTLDTDYSPADGFCVYEEAWADQISIGPMVLTDVPIRLAGLGNATRLGAQYEGTLGLAGLKRLDFIVDGKNGLAYWRAKSTPPPVYPHNRLGAVFVPTQSHTNQAVARVVQGGPAYEAGVRDGDVLLRVDNVMATSWNTGWLRYLSMPAGTKLKLTLKRDGETFSTTATLRQLLQPSPAKDK